MYRDADQETLYDPETNTWYYKTPSLGTLNAGLATPALPHNPYYYDGKLKTSSSFVELESPKKRYCIPTSRRARWCCLICLFLMVGVLAILLYLYIPRFPALNVLSLNVADNQSLQVYNQSTGNINDIAVSLLFVMKVSLVNTNRYTLKVEDINLSAFLVGNATALTAGPSPSQLLALPNAAPLVINSANDQTKVGYGKVSNLAFPPGVNSTFLMDFQLFYKPNPKTGLFGDVAFAEILQGCGITSPRRIMTVAYSAQVTVSVLKSLGYYPTIQDSLHVHCPFTDDGLAQIISALGPLGNELRNSSIGM